MSWKRPNRHPASRRWPTPVETVTDEVVAAVTEWYASARQVSWPSSALSVVR